MRSYRIGVVGAGYVGLTTAACLARLGHHVVCADIDANKVGRLRRGAVDVHEPGLPSLVDEGLRTERLAFVTDSRTAVADADLLFVCVPTPIDERGETDLSAVHAVLRQAKIASPAGCVLVIKSTVPVGTTDHVTDVLNRPDVPVVHNPEFLREGHAVTDFLAPRRIVIGTRSRQPADQVAGLYAACHAPTVVTDPASAELVKYASNCFLAMKLSYVNELAEVCERVGADIADVTDGMRHDSRIGADFLRPGPGWGGSCLPKDTRALLSTAAAADIDFGLLRATIDANSGQVNRITDKIRAAVTGSARQPLAGVRVALLGLTFKAGTDDLRDSPALAIATRLAAEGAELTGYDPALAGTGSDIGPVHLVNDPYLAAKDASAVVLLTEWPEFAELDWPRLAGEARDRVVVDTRNHLPSDALRQAGFHYHGLGRGRHDAQRLS